ncbi:MAG: TIM barrel protein [Caldilineaceae bacterium]
MKGLFLPGLVSITFRQLTPAEIVALVAQAGLDAIEWGGDVHVPHGALAAARTVRQMSADAGLQVAAYGSYYRVSHAETGPFETVLESAIELGAPSIRVWAGRQGSADADETYWGQVVDDSRRIADLAAAAGIRIDYEFHGNTLTDTNESAAKLLTRVAHANVKTYWQPPRYAALDYNLAGLDAVLPWLQNIHTFMWHRQTGERCALAAGADDWRQYLDKAAAATPAAMKRYILIEFVQNDAPANFLADAQTLRAWLAPET